MSGFARSASFPLAVLLVVAPGLAVAQFRIMAPAVPIALLLVLAADWRVHRTLPRPRIGAVGALALGLLGWALLSAAWSIEPRRAVETTLSLGVLVGLGLLAAAAIARDGAAHRARIGPALAVGLAIGVALLAFDHASWNLFRRAVRGLPDWTPFIGFGLKPAVSLLALLLPLVLAVPGLSRLAKAALVATGLLVALWLPAESAKLAVIAGLLAAGAAALAPGLAWRAAAAGLAGLVFATPLLFALLLPRLPDLSPLPASAAHRVLIWDFVLHRVAERPILGWGMEASRAVPEGTAMFTAATLDRFGLESEAERARFLQPFVQRLPLHPHNAPLQIWLELGLVGAAIAAGLVAAVMRAVGRGSIAPAALGAAVSGLVTALLSFGVWQPWWIASLVLAALIVAAFSAAASPRSAPAGDRAG